MTHQLNLIDSRQLPVAARPSVGALMVLALLVSLGLGGHWGWERVRLTRALALPETPVAASGTDTDTEAPDPAFEARLRTVERDEALRTALAGVTDLPQDSATRLRNVAAVLPDALWLTEIELSGRHGVRIAGGTLEPAALADYASRLGKVPGLTGLPLQAMTVEPGPSGAAEGVADGEGARVIAAHHRFTLASGGAFALAGAPR